VFELFPAGRFGFAVPELIKKVLKSICICGGIDYYIDSLMLKI